MAAAKKTKSGLGKGLDTLIPKADPKPAKEGTKKEESAEKGAVTMLKTSQVEPNRDQPRKQFDEEALSELASSIKEYGIIQPIIVTKRADYYEIIAGERRWRAAKKAGLKEIPVVVKDYSEKEIAEISLIENIQRENLNPIEEANAYKKLIDDYKLTQEELSNRISKSRTVITNTLRLLKLHEDVQEMLANGSLSAGHARALVALEDKELQLKTAEKIVEGTLSVRQTEDLVKELLEPKKEKTAKEKVKNNVIYQNLEKELTESLGTKVRIKQKEKGKGKIEIAYFSEDDLDRLYRALIN